MKPNVTALASGLTFGAGLVVSGMTRPSKVLGFLDIAGSWDVSLAFVMVGAIGVHALIARWIGGRSAPLFDTQFHLPARSAVDRPLVVGATLFGIGWGLAGYCPGPAFVSLASGATAPVVFVLAMTVGMIAAQRGRRKKPTAA